MTDVTLIRSEVVDRGEAIERERATPYRSVQRAEMYPFFSSTVQRYHRWCPDGHEEHMVQITTAIVMVMSSCDMLALASKMAPKSLPVP